MGNGEGGGGVVMFILISDESFSFNPSMGPLNRKGCIGGVFGYSWRNFNACIKECRNGLKHCSSYL